MTKPDFFIVGAPKCGTTALNDYLAQHPDVFMATKELHFFGSDIHFARDMTEDRYLSCFSQAGDAKRVGEASVWYLYSEHAAKEIKKACPDANIIIMLRNPADMVPSLHSRMLATLEEDIQDFEEALEAEKDRAQGLRIPKQARMPQVLLYRQIASYTDQVSRYFDVFGRDRVQVIIFDEFVSRTDELYAETLAFLGLSTDFAPPFENINPNIAVRSRVAEGFLKNPSGLARSLVRTLLPAAFSVRLRGTLKRWNSKRVTRSPISPELRSRLQAEFAPEIERLSALLGHDLSHWIRG